MTPVIFYCYDAYCNWCYAFSSVITKIAGNFSDRAHFEVLSGGMIITDTPKPIAVMADYMLNNCNVVQEQTGVTFGQDFLWHLRNPGLSDWFPNSEKPAIALCIFKEYYPNNQVAFAADLQYALQYEGRDLDDDEAYRHLLLKYNIPADEFYKLLKDPAYKEKAYYEFTVCKQLKVTGFPALMMQVSESKFIMLASGYTPYEVLHERIEKIFRDFRPG
jgi:putative protein-disulfide isomerase